MRTTALVIPCYNEAARLRPEAFVDFVRGHNRYRLLFVDDGSRDNTTEVLAALEERVPGAIDWMSLTENAGKAEAVRQGLLKTCDLPGVRYSGFWDADLSTPLEIAPDYARVLDAHPTVRAVVGSRMILCGRRIARDWHRRLLGAGFARVASWVLGTRIRDTQCGAKMLRTTDLDVLLNRPFRSRWIFDVELLQRLRRATGRSLREVVWELPLEAWTEVGGSRLKSTDFLRAIRELSGIALSSLWQSSSPPTILLDEERFDDDESYRRAA